MGGHHGPKVPEVPDWRIYKVEDVPQLVCVKRALAFHGLKNPWLRNEVWRYKEFIIPYPLTKTLKSTFKKGFKYGLIAAIITTLLEKSYFGFGGGHKEEHGTHH